MNYEKDYKELIERINLFHREVNKDLFSYDLNEIDGEQTMKDLNKLIYQSFPNELKESEDKEKIRQSIIEDGY